MRKVGDKTQLIADAQQVLGDGEPVLHAGVFGMQGFMKQTSGREPEDLHPVTTKLIVAVTATHVYVLNWDEGDNQRWVYATFDRETTTATIKHFGASRILSLHDPSTGAQMNLRAVGREFAQSEPERDVIAELVPTG